VYHIRLMPRVIKDLKKLPKNEVKNIIYKIQNLKSGLTGNVKKLTNFTPEYRLRVGNYRILFEVEENEIIIYCVKHRSKAYR